MGCFSDVYLWRQALILFGDSLSSLGTGFMWSFSSVLNPAILSPSSTDIRATSEEASWISASLGFAGVVGYFFIPYIFQNLGRKFVHIILNILVALGFIVFYFANNTTALFVGKFIQGTSTCGVTIAVMLIAEYSYSKRRGYFMTIRKCTTALGSLICHSLFITCTWRQIALLAAVPSIISTILILFWPESPAYLAMKGRFEECNESYTWLFGESVKCKKDLDELITAQLRRRNKERKSSMELVMRILSKFVRRDFMQPLIIAAFLTVIIEASGRYYMMAYIIQIVIEITGDKSLALYCSIGADVFTIIALVVSSFVVRLMSRRSILFYFGYTTVAFMYMISIALMLKTKYGIGTDLPWLIPSLIIVNTFVCNVGVTPTAFTIIGEIFPLEHKGTASFTAGIFFTSLYGITVKFVPLMMDKVGVDGMFAIFATCLLLSFIFLYFILIETKDKTLQEIEDEIKGVKHTAEKLSDQQAKYQEI